MEVVDKACPIVLRQTGMGADVLAFEHPNAGRQLVKGTIEAGEQPYDAAVRELYEESGVRPVMPLTELGVARIGGLRQSWHFFTYLSVGLPERWDHQTTDDYGHVFRFFWQPLNSSLSDEWHADFHAAFAFVRAH